MGTGYEWTGTADFSTSTRTDGMKILSPTNGRGNLTLREDGTIARCFFDAKEIQFSDFQAADFEPYFPFQFNGNLATNVLNSGVSAGVVNIVNEGNGCALQVVSGGTSAIGMIVDGSSVTSGAILGVFAPSDLTAMQAAGGKFFTFAGKAQNADMYTWYVDVVQMGALGYSFGKDVVVYGGGSQVDSARAIAGNVSVTAASPTVTGSGFLTNFKRSNSITISDVGGDLTYTILSVDSNTSLTLTQNYGGTTGSYAHDGKTLQYKPPVIHLEGAYANHIPARGDYMYGIYASGGNGHLRVMKSAALGVAVTPTADNDGDGIVTSRNISSGATAISSSTTETTMITGYTSPANELLAGTVFRISFGGQIAAIAPTTTIIWRVKLGGTTILTSNTQQVGSTATIDYTGTVTIIGVTSTTQEASISIMGKDTGVTPGPTYGLCGYDGTGTVDMRLDQALTVTAQMGDASSILTMQYYALEIL
jgi:hypothetical protein